MKTKTILLFSLFLSLGFLTQNVLAQTSQGGGAVPTSPTAFPPPPDGSSQYGFNLNFIGAAMYPQTQDTFVPLTETLDDFDLFDHIFDHPVVVSERDAVENTTSENVITILQGSGVVVYLGKTWIQASYDAITNDYLFKNPWSFEKANSNLEGPLGWFDGAVALFPEASKNQLKNQELCQKFTIYFPFKAVELGRTTVTFTRQDVLHAKSKVLTFQFNVVAAAPAASTTSGNDN